MRDKTQAFHWSSAAATHVGLVRKINEDAFLNRADAGLWAVADGMGGHHAGDVASSSIVRALDDLKPETRISDNSQNQQTLDELRESRLGTFVNDVEDRLLGINIRLRNMADEHQDNRTIGSTVVAMLSAGKYCAFVWAGDSRAYLLRAGKSGMLTRDHSQVEELVARGLLAPEEAESHPASNIITRAVGASRNLVFDVNVEPVTNGDTYLLCSDGLYKHLTMEDMSKIMAQPNLQTAAHDLVNLTIERGATDNVTVVLVRAEESEN